MTEKSQKAAVKHVLSAIRPAQLRTRLEQDIAFSHNDLKANFDGFMAHALDVSAAFEKIDFGNPKSSKPENRKSPTGRLPVRVFSQSARARTACTG